MWRGGAEVLSTSWFSQVNLKWLLPVGAWNVLSQREDDHLSLLSSLLQHLNIGIAAFSEVQRPESAEIMMAGLYIMMACLHSDGYHAEGVAVTVSNKLTPMIIKTTPVN